MDFYLGAALRISLKPNNFSSVIGIRERELCHGAARGRLLILSVIGPLLQLVEEIIDKCCLSYVSEIDNVSLMAKELLLLKLTGVRPLRMSVYERPFIELLSTSIPIYQSRCWFISLFASQVYVYLSRH